MTIFFYIVVSWLFWSDDKFLWETIFFSLLMLHPISRPTRRVTSSTENFFPFSLCHLFNVCPRWNAIHFRQKYHCRYDNSCDDGRDANLCLGDKAETKEDQWPFSCQSITRPPTSSYWFLFSPWQYNPGSTHPSTYLTTMFLRANLQPKGNQYLLVTMWRFQR